MMIEAIAACAAMGTTCSQPDLVKEGLGVTQHLSYIRKGQLLQGLLIRKRLRNNILTGNRCLPRVILRKKIREMLEHAPTLRVYNLAAKARQQPGVQPCLFINLTQRGLLLSLTGLHMALGQPGITGALRDQDIQPLGTALAE